MSRTRKAEHERSRAAFESSHPAQDFTRINMPGGTRYADLTTFAQWLSWKKCWRWIKENGINE
jgi:hypothetical protein